MNQSADLIACSKWSAMYPGIYKELSADVIATCLFLLLSKLEDTKKRGTKQYKPNYIN